MLEGPRLHKMAFPTPVVRPLDESQGSSLLQGHGSWLMCEVALSVLYPTKTQEVVAKRLKYRITHVYLNDPKRNKTHTYCT